MYYLEYDLPQLTKIAEDNLRNFDAERLRYPKPLDAMDFTELKLDLQTEPQRLTPNLSIWGLTAFNDGYWYIWPEGEEFPTKHPVCKQTMLIDERLLLPDASVGWRNFTVLHEGFHWILHQKVFARQEVKYQLHLSKDSVSSNIGKKKPQLSGIAITEWQANAAAAAFLMPRGALTTAFRELLKVSQSQILPIQWTPTLDAYVYKLAELFSASYPAMKYRLNDLNLMRGFPCPSAAV